MVEIQKNIGKIMNSTNPELIYATVHKRHYYMTDCTKAWKIHNKIVKELKNK